MSCNACGIILLALVVPFLFATLARANEPLLRLDKSFDLKTVRVVGEAKVALVPQGEDAVVRVEAPQGTEMSGVTFPAPPGNWDLSTATYVVADVRNVGPHQVKVRCRVENPGVAPGYNVKFGINPEGNFVNGDVMLAPGQSGCVQVELRRIKPQWIKVDLFGMVCYPWGQCQSADSGKTGGAVDAAKIANICFYVRKPFHDQAFEISSIRAIGQYEQPVAILKDPDKFLPFIDEYGQYIHADWPTKIHKPKDLTRHRKAETRDLAVHPGPAGWDAYGGWQGGPSLKATGWFRVAKYNGKWWLVDPEGRLFFPRAWTA